MSIHLTAIVLAATMPALAADDFRREGNPERRAALAELEGKDPPPLMVRGWMNSGGEALDLAALRGKVVLLDFWGVWCGPCRRSIPHLKELYEAHRDQGLVVIGVHTNRGADGAPAFVEEAGIPYPVCIDERAPGTDADEANGRTGVAYQVDSFPDYYLIDRGGRLRVADLANEDVDRAVGILLKEAPPVTAEGLADDWPQATYDYLRAGAPAGTLSLRQERAEQDGRRAMRLHDVLKLETEGRRGMLELESLCEPDPLFRPIRVYGRIQEPGGEPSDLALSFAGGRVTGSARGETLSMEVPPDTALALAVFRIASRMPFEEGATRSFTAFELVSLGPAGKWTLTCKGQEETELDGEPVQAWRFERTAPSKSPMHLWYAPDRRLLRASWDEGSEELVLARTGTQER